MNGKAWQHVESYRMGKNFNQLTKNKLFCDWGSNKGVIKTVVIGSKCSISFFYYYNNHCYDGCSDGVIMEKKRQ